MPIRLHNDPLLPFLWKQLEQLDKLLDSKMILLHNSIIFQPITKQNTNIIGSLE